MSRATVSSVGIIVGLMGCAPGPAPSPARTDRILVTTESRVLKASEGTPSNSVMVKASREKALAALREVYSDRGIEVKMYDPVSGQLGNRNFSRTGRLGGERLSTFLGCGMMISGEAADNYRVTMSVVSQATPGADGLKLETWLTAAARDLGTSSADVSCASKGTLEAKINRLVQERIAR